MDLRKLRIAGWLLLSLAIAGVAITPQVTAQELFKRLARALMGDPVPPSALLTEEQAPIQVSRDQLEIGITNAYDSSGIRYLAIHLRIANRTENDLIVRSSDCRLEIGKEIAPRVTKAAELNRMPVTLGGEDNDSVDPLKAQGLNQFPVPPGKSRSAWMIFAPLPKVRELPEMVLNLETSQGVIKLPLTQSEIGRLKVETRRIGPSGCVAIARISGEVSALNLHELVNQLNRGVPGSPQSLVLSFQPGSVIRGPLVEEWFVDAREGDNERLKFMPSWPGGYHSTVVVGLPNQSDETGDALASSEAEAVRMVARPIIPKLDTTSLRHELRDGSPEFRSAILQDHGDLVAQIEPSAILAALESDQTPAEMRPSLIQSLRSINDPHALELLDRMTRQGSREESLLALRSLNLSPLPGARSRALALVRDQAIRQRIGLARILDSVGVEIDEVWLPVLYEAFADADSEARQTALREILALGSTERQAILEKAFADPSDDVRETAYAAIIGQRSNEEEPLFVRETYRRFREGARDRHTLIGVEELRDPALIPDLLKSIDASPGDSIALVNTCLSLGASEILPELEKRFPRLHRQSQRQLLKVMQQRAYPPLRKLAVTLLTSPDDEVRAIATAILVFADDSESYDALRSCIEANADNRIAVEIVRFIGIAATSRSRRFLESLAAERDPQLKWLAHTGTNQQLSAHPNVNWRDVAMDLARSGEVEGQIEALKLAIEVDDQDVESLSNLGMAYVQQSRHAEALPIFRKSLQMNPDAHLPLTGIAICYAVEGRVQEAVRMVDRRELLNRWGQEQLYLYNTACVYGRAAEYLAKQPQALERDLLLKAYQGRAVHLLQCAVDQGFRQLTLLSEDPDLNSLRQLPEFQELPKRIMKQNLQ